MDAEKEPEERSTSLPRGTRREIDATQSDGGIVANESLPVQQFQTVYGARYQCLLEETEQRPDFVTSKTQACSDYLEIV